jgi:hypothetical protein
VLGGLVTGSDVLYVLLTVAVFILFGAVIRGLAML